MLNFKPITQKDGARLRQYYKNCSYRLCEYSAGTKLMWRDTLHPAWAEACGCLLVRNCVDGKFLFDYPVPGPEGDEAAALDTIEMDCLSQGIAPAFSVIPEEKAPVLLARYPYACFSNIRSWKDYLYYTEDLQYFSGRRYSGQRNHIKKFYKKYPQAIFRPLTGEDRECIEAFWQDYLAEFPKKADAKALRELQLARKLVRLLDRPWFLGGGLFDGDKLVALSLAERCGETLIIHIEKGLYSYEGVYPTLVQAFAQHYGDRVKWLNREDDAADRGLRTSKLQYGPALMASKYCVELRNELQVHANGIPVLKTERLQLSELTEADLPAYNALVLDQERNRWWGYDDVAGLGSPVEEDSFLNVARRDFEARLAVNFAVRLQERLIGEAVLYRFNYRGEAELGCRIASEYAGSGYGAEAFAAVADWGLYQLHLNRVVAKCFRENRASYKMLASCMRPCGEDETYFYFEKKV